MKKNLGRVDRLIRALFAAITAICYFSHVINGATATVLLSLAGILLFTSLVSFCPLYFPFGISTLNKNNNR